MSEIRAIAMDTSAFSNGLPRIRLIKQWAIACEDNAAELWIPEVVALELAEHVVRETRKDDEQLRRYSRQRGEWGLTSIDLPKPVGVDDVVARIKESGAVLVRLDGESARQAIVDQITLRGAGEKKGGVKTGAADSAWIRSLAAHNDGDLAGVVVVTNDRRALEQTVAALKIAPPLHVEHMRALDQLLDPSDEDIDALAKEFIEWAKWYFSSPEGFTARDLFPLWELGKDPWWTTDFPHPFNRDWEHQESSLSPRTAEVSNVDFSPWSRTISCTITLVSDVEDQYSAQDHLGNEPVYLSVRYEGAVEVTASAFVNADGTFDFDEVKDDWLLIDNPDDRDMDYF